MDSLFTPLYTSGLAAPQYRCDNLSIRPVRPLSAATDGIQKAFVSDITHSNRKGTGLGIYNAMLGITLLPASIIAGVLYDKAGSAVPFYFGGAMALRRLY